VTQLVGHDALLEFVVGTISAPRSHAVNRPQTKC
jgi:hypothetical protein